MNRHPTGRLVGPLSAISGPSAPQQTACLLGGFPNLHNPRHSDCKGRTTTGLALDRDVAAHHLTEAPADHETKASTTVFSSGRRIGLGKFLEQLARLLCGHADAGISHSDGNRLAAIFVFLA